MEILTNPETIASTEGSDLPVGDFSRPLCSADLFPPEPEPEMIPAGMQIWVVILDRETDLVHVVQLETRDDLPLDWTQCYARQSLKDGYQLRSATDTGITKVDRKKAHLSKESAEQYRVDNLRRRIATMERQLIDSPNRELSNGGQTPNE